MRSQKPLTMWTLLQLMEAEGLQWLSNNHTTVTNTWLLLREIRKWQKMMKWSLSDESFFCDGYFLYPDFCSLFAMVISCIQTSSFLSLIREGGLSQRGGYVQEVSIPEGRGLNMSRGGRRWVFQGWVSQNEGDEYRKGEYPEGVGIPTKNEEICRLRQKYVVFVVKLTRLVTQTDDRFYRLYHTVWR